MKQKKHRSSTRIPSKAIKSLTYELKEFNAVFDKLPDTFTPSFPIPEYFDGNLVVNLHSMAGKFDISLVSTHAEMEF